MRAFIAVSLPQEIKEKLHKAQEHFKRLGLEASWTNKDNLHLTLKFLGEIDQERLERVRELIKERARKHTVITASLAHFGFFPDEKRPRVFFAACSHEGALSDIAAGIEESLQPEGFAKEGRFRAHITLARIKSPKNISLLKEEIQKIKLEGDFPVDSITLFKSTLAPQGAVYEEILKENLRS